ncbi:L-glutamate gamma-semialdehyde dehydrogenase [Terribacillus sp. 179-K 1B1 HS]|uniref:L-glutamate gamma-semialdehyde dehydrogenase n=1 Tax=Terribacillus sp. 179-K 1B1 HS TaxID=3142388 RepID=UPI0039A1713F
MTTPYKHEPFTDFTQEKEQQAFSKALEQVQKVMGESYPLVIDGEKVTTDEKIVSINPANKEEVVGEVSKASQEHAERAIEAAATAFETWRYTKPEERAHILMRAAAIVRRKKHYFSALLVKEAGKPWKEADADTAEAIDFMEYYARQMIELAPGKAVKSREGEANRYIYTPTGVTVVISPWNFLFAIMAGTTVAPLVTGNTVVLKPASATPVIAAQFVEVLEEAGVPKGVINFVPGSGSEVGDYLVEHPKTSIITFTGSRDVGTRIFEKAAKVQPGQQHLKRVIAEMGGKDTVVVDEDADIELAADAIAVSAFGFAGQKCSAGSRAVVHEKVYDAVLQRVIEITESRITAAPESADVYMGPVIDQDSFDKITDYIEVGKQEGKLVSGGSSDDSKGFFIQPTIFSELSPTSRLMQEEIFGPVLGFSKVSSFEEAIDVANNTEYGLTGAVITKNRAHIEYAKERFHVGNLYFNRNCTGAIVGYHPFGGFKMSGTDSKAGGPDYLQLHTLAKTVSEMY